MSELIIKTKYESGSRGKTAVVISLDTSVKEKVDSIALATGYSFNEVIDLLLNYALPHCKIDDGASHTPEPPKPAASQPAFSKTPAARPTLSKLSSTAEPAPEIPKTLPKTPAETVKPAEAKPAPAKTADAPKPAAVKTTAAAEIAAVKTPETQKTTAIKTEAPKTILKSAATSAKPTPQAEAEPAKPSAKTAATVAKDPVKEDKDSRAAAAATVLKNAKANLSAKTTTAKEVDIHASVPTFTLPPITKTGDKK